MTESSIDEDLEGFPEAEVVFVETDRLLGLFLPFNLHGGGPVTVERVLKHKQPSVTRVNRENTVNVITLELSNTACAL